MALTDHFALSSRTAAGHDAPTLMLRALLYNPSTVAAGIVAGFYLAFGLALLFRMWTTKSWWGLVLPISAIGSGLGFIIRILMVQSHQDSKGFLILQTVLIACCPAGFLAFNYILYGRLVVHCIGPRFSLIRPGIVARTFIISDVVTFLVQAGGGSLELNDGQVTLGKNIFLAGIALQSASYYIFIVLVAYTHVKVKRASGATTGRERWWTVLYVLYVSSAFIVVRTIYRLIEGIGGRNGRLSTHEVYFYVLDAIPLLIAIGVWIPWFPANYIDTSTTIAPQDSFKMTTRPINGV